ncbi:MAG: hypothetical protein Q9216_004598 [Gyalolechia sp. 2 TL-2023]
MVLWDILKQAIVAMRVGGCDKIRPRPEITLERHHHPTINPPPTTAALFSMADQTLNIPSLVVAAVIVFFSVRYFFFSSSTSIQAASDRNTANPAHIEQLAQMFPQLNRRDIQWDLQRNGGSVQATTERVLSGRGLERPPPSFQPIQPPPSSSSSTTPINPPPPRSSHPDLITRYKLQSRISQPEPSNPGDDDEGEEEGKPHVPEWGRTKAERQSLLQERKHEMVLAARRRFEEKERERAAGKD